MKLSIPHDSIFYKIISATGQLVIKITEATLMGFSPQKGSVFMTTDYPWAEELESNTDIIVQELKQVMQDYESIPNLDDLSAEQKRIISGKQGWKTFFLYTYGTRVDKNALRCPHTDALVKKIPGMTMAFFSILEPHTSLLPHRGPYKGVLRYHLGLIIPQQADQCGIKVDGTTYHWAYGKSLIFDDTYQHEAWNNSDELRVVLFIDFKRTLYFPFNIFNDLMIKLIGASPFVANILKKIEKPK